MQKRYELEKFSEFDVGWCLGWLTILVHSVALIRGESGGDFGNIELRGTTEATRRNNKI